MKISCDNHPEPDDVPLPEQSPGIIQFPPLKARASSQLLNGSEYPLSNCSPSSEWNECLTNQSSASGRERRYFNNSSNNQIHSLRILVGRNQVAQDNPVNALNHVSNAYLRIGCQLTSESKFHSSPHQRGVEPRCEDVATTAVVSSSITAVEGKERVRTTQGSRDTTKSVKKRRLEILTRKDSPDPVAKQPSPSCQGQINDKQAPPHTGEGSDSFFNEDSDSRRSVQQYRPVAKRTAGRNTSNDEAQTQKKRIKLDALLKRGGLARTQKGSLIRFVGSDVAELAVERYKAKVVKCMVCENFFQVHHRASVLYCRDCHSSTRLIQNPVSGSDRITATNF